jgi:hypothetical protein
MENIIQKLKEANCILWETTKHGFTKILHRGIINLIHLLGYAQVKIASKYIIVKAADGIIAVATEKDIVANVNDFIVNQLQSSPEDTFDKEKLVEAWTRQSEFVCSKRRLQLLGTINVEQFQDTKEKSYLFFKNGIVAVTKDSINVLPFGVDGKYVWEEKINPRIFNTLSTNDPAGEFEILVSNVC